MWYLFSEGFGRLKETGLAMSWVGQEHRGESFWLTPTRHLIVDLEYVSF